MANNPVAKRLLRHAQFPGHYGEARPSFTRCSAATLNSAVYACLGTLNIPDSLPFRRVYPDPLEGEISGELSLPGFAQLSRCLHQAMPDPSSRPSRPGERLPYPPIVRLQASAVLWQLSIRYKSAPSSRRRPTALDWPTRAASIIAVAPCRALRFMSEPCSRRMASSRRLSCPRTTYRSSASALSNACERIDSFKTARCDYDVGEHVEAAFGFDNVCPNHNFKATAREPSTTRPVSVSSRQRYAQHGGPRGKQTRLHSACSCMPIMKQETSGSATGTSCFSAPRKSSTLAATCSRSLSTQIM